MRRLKAKPVPPKMPKEAEMKDESTQVGWTTNLPLKVSTTTGAIETQAFEPVYLKPEMGNSLWKFATADGQTIADLAFAELVSKETEVERRFTLSLNYDMAMHLSLSNIDHPLLPGSQRHARQQSANLRREAAEILSLFTLCCFSYPDIWSRVESTGDVAADSKNICTSALSSATAAAAPPTAVAPLLPEVGFTPVTSMQGRNGDSLECVGRPGHQGRLGPRTTPVSRGHS
ncbi:zinc-binding dehydrogenase family protein [Aspergillus tubingensis]|uniref:zinc-binding dehydrogenase family protein n=1 Tax=Aspergillus tubingensis TaxID=5068 RepID=UPI001577B814|nr:zinc-binding dehydrogenase family protein [Aspergillus tubingensis]GFN12829.1 zinc-binding dehydrogenase family protein [Aspergillus tubingensis]